MEKLLILGFILLIINSAKFSVNAVYDVCAKQSSLKTYGLKQKLLCDYDTLARPSDVNATKVGFGMIPKLINFNDKAHTLTVFGWVDVSWRDAHFDWRNDGQYSSIPFIHVSSSEIWTPDISLYNSGKIGNEQTGIPVSSCKVRKDGWVQCLVVVKYVTRCAPNYQNWPFDRQNCTLRLGAWAYTKEEIYYTLRHYVVDEADYTESLEWKILSTDLTNQIVMFSGSTDLHPSIFFNFILERYSTHRLATVIVPAILLIIMTLTVLWLSPMTFERMILAGLNLICHLICVLEIHWHVPFNGATLPSILIFHQNSMIIASVAFFLTVFLRQLEEISIPAPVWLTSTTSVILESRAGQFFLLTTLDPKASATLETVENDNAGLVERNSSDPRINPGTSAWHHFATLIDRLSFAGIILTYAIMLAVLIPRKDIEDANFETFIRK